jgi:xanthine dehydrogenase accessory factor
MKEIKDIVQAYDLARAQGLEVALATVVKVEGSSYRHEGARMLVDEEGQLTGAISGGCLEGDARKKALLCMHQKVNKIAVYDTREEGNAGLGLQLGCNGVVHILFEYIAPHQMNNPVELLRLSQVERRPSVLATCFDPPRGTVALFNGQYTEVVSCGLKDILGSVTKTQVIDGTVYTCYAPTLRLIIAGAGNDVQPLVNMAALLGWEVILVDGRPNLLTEKRFPSATQRVVSTAEDVDLDVDAQTYVLLMSHNYRYDLVILKWALGTVVPYVGVLGPSSKRERMLKELGITGERVYGPVGLDLGAETAEEIALSILAEIMAVSQGRKGGPLTPHTC